MWRHCYGFSKRRHQVGISSISPIIFATGVISLGPLGALVLSFFFEQKSASCRSKQTAWITETIISYLFHLLLSSTCFIYILVSSTCSSTELRTYFIEIPMRTGMTHIQSLRIISRQRSACFPVWRWYWSWPFLTNLHSVVRWIPRDFPWRNRTCRRHGRSIERRAQNLVTLVIWPLIQYQMVN